MTCEECQEAWSARRDGEATPAEPDPHLSGCAPCQAWVARAEALTRIGRLAAVAPLDYRPAQDPVVLAARPAPGRRARLSAAVTRWVCDGRRLASGLRFALGVVGTAQFLLGLAQITALGQAMVGRAHSVSSAHLWNESAAWNLAIGAAFSWVALRRTKTSGLVPLLTAFVSTIVILGLGDLLDGLVDPTRLISHGLIVLGYLIVLTLSRPRFNFPDPYEVEGQPPAPWRARFDSDTEQAPAPVMPLRPVVAEYGHRPAA